ncbi:MAG: hypothetical protein HOP29_15000 [Phycisphaerales bacterium]|nr:hypothetical protein [Phycisphaerales bacterium]
MKAIGQLAESAILVAVVGLFSGCTAPRRVHVRVVQADTPTSVPASRRGKIETLSLALLEGSTYENDEAVANTGVWNQYEARDCVASVGNGVFGRAG